MKINYVISPPSDKADSIVKSIEHNGNKEAVVHVVTAEQITDTIKNELSDKTICILIDQDTNNNTRYAFKIANEKYDGDKIEIYTESVGKSSELLLDSLQDQVYSKENILIRRLFPERSMVYRELYENSLFDLAKEQQGEKIVSIVIVGVDSFGMEMLKACLWCGQMDGFVLKISVIDEALDIESRFFAEAPEIKERNKIPRAGEDYYELDFYPGINNNSIAFETLFAETIDFPTHVYISQEDDVKAIETAIHIREICARRILKDRFVPEHYSDSEQKPCIKVRINNDHMADILNQNQLVNYRQQAYNIFAIGNYHSIWNIDTILNDQLEELALRAHLKWGDRESFDKYEYNRRSSMASAIHKKYRDHFYPNDDIMKDILEHKRWNAYMRSTEGYRFGYLRDDLARQHNCLIKYNNLSGVEKEKDRNMNSD